MENLIFGMVSAAVLIGSGLYMYLGYKAQKKESDRIEKDLEEKAEYWEKLNRRKDENN